jgi:hypothetical protein
MFRGRELASVALEEIALLESNDLSPEEPALESRVAELMLEESIPETGILGYVLEEAFWTSLTCEEGRPSRFRLIYDPSSAARGTHDPNELMHRLHSPVPLNRETMRKLVPVHHPRGGGLVWSGHGGRPVITAIRFPGPDFPLQAGPPLGFTISSETVGGLEVSWSSHVLLSCRGGISVRLSSCALPNATALAGFLGPSFETICAAAPRIVDTLVAEGHGGSVWVIRTANRPIGVRIGHVIAGGLRMVMRSADPLQNRANIVSLANLAAVDGALLLDNEARPLGFSVFFTEELGDLEVDVLDGSGGFEAVRIADIGGARHRSAAAFCRRNAPAVGIIASADGRISVIKCEYVSGRVQLAQLAPLGMYLGMVL